MSLTDNNNGMVMPVSPMYGGGNTGHYRLLIDYSLDFALSRLIHHERKDAASITAKSS